MNDRLRVGVIGAGRIGSLHVRNLVTRIPKAEVVAISDIRREAAAQSASELGIPMVTTDPEAVLRHPDVDAVLICSSTDTHAALIEAAAGAGKHIFCEKPIDLDLARVDRVLATVKEAGVKLMVGFNRRFDHNFRRVRELVAEGAVGEPHILHIISRDPAPPPLAYVKVSGGIFLDMTIHDFDMARFLMGCEVTELYVEGGVRVDPAIGEAGDIDTAVITLRFENGAIGTIDNSRRATYGYDQRVEVFGSRGSVRTENDFANTALVSDGDSIRTDLPLNFFMDRYTESYVTELTQFVDCVLANREPPATGQDGRMAILMGYAARKSYAAHRPVRIEEVTFERSNV
ncbi:MAG: inositol 2-dehydrogenase [Anaerolineae bacterium]|nr:inositol 2-dehydrogenase [Anaerolineae bacterium]